MPTIADKGEAGPQGPQQPRTVSEEHESQDRMSSTRLKSFRNHKEATGWLKRTGNERICSGEE